MKDPVMKKILDLWHVKWREGWTLEQLGVEMGFPAQSARQSANQFLQASNPFISSLRRFAKAVGVAVESLVDEEDQ